MSTELKKTYLFVGAALLLGLLAWIAAPKPITSEAFRDQGEVFFPDFTNPNDATSLEVVSFDEQTGTAQPFKVEFANGRWTIPSHNNYPADGKDRLAKTAAGVIDLRRGDFRTDLPSEYQACGVIDPLDESIASPAGRGRRITIAGASGDALADLIVGAEVPGRAGFRFVRVPGEKRVYATKFDADISANFADWIEKDLLRTTKGSITKIILNDYSINERTLSVDQRERLVLQKNAGGTGWKFEGGKGGKPDSGKVESLLLALDELSIVGVRPKPKGLADVLNKVAGANSISQQDWYSLQEKGYYLTRDGQLLSNEGEVQFFTDNNLHYTLRFGEVAYGSGAALTAGGTPESSSNAAASDNRYLFISIDYTGGGKAEPPKPTDLLFQTKPDSLWSAQDRANKSLQETWEAWEQSAGAEKKFAGEMNSRFSQWYYVISAESFGKLRLRRSDLLAKS